MAYFFLVKILGFSKRAKILGLHCIKIPGLTPVEILQYFITTRFLTPKATACVACQNLGFFKDYQDIGLTSYRNLRFSTCRNLGVFHKNHVFDAQNPWWPTFSCQNLRIFEECKDFGPTLYQNFIFNTCRNLGVFLKNQVFDTKNPLPVWLVKIVGFLKSTKILGLHRIEILGLAGLSKSWGIS